jgi:NAD(P)-dependent dehydrogenase (short-subunit alcohol dehydrogenase family)
MQTALVTGGTKNIGLAIATRLLKRGWRVVVLSRMQNPSEELASLEARFSGRLLSFTTDVTRVTDLQEVAREISRMSWKLDLLVNSAGGLWAVEPLFETEPAAFQQVVELNVCGVFNSCHIFGQSLNPGVGCIVNLSGGGASAALENGCNLAYSSAKAAILRLTEAMANQLRASGTNVYAVDPGWVPWPEVWDDIRRRQSQGEIVDISSVRPADATADLIEFLLENNAPELSGKCFSVLDDYRSTIAHLRVHRDNDALTLRMAAVNPPSTL